MDDGCSDRAPGRIGPGGLLQPGDTWRALLFRLLHALPVLAGTASYFLINQLTVYRTDQIVLAFPFDPYLPFIPSFVYVYLTYHVAIAASVLLYIYRADRRADLTRYVSALFIGSIAAAVTFLIMPTHVPRPEITGDTLTLRLLRLVYAQDEPFNCFPSLHVIWTFVMCFNLQKLIGHHRLATLANWSYLVLICVSTVVLRQHYTPDVVGGLVVGLAAIVLSEMPFRQRRRA